MTTGKAKGKGKGQVAQAPQPSTSTAEPTPTVRTEPTRTLRENSGGRYKAMVDAGGLGSHTRASLKKV